MAATVMRETSKLSPGQPSPAIRKEPAARPIEKTHRPQPAPSLAEV